MDSAWNLNKVRFTIIATLCLLAYIPIFMWMYDRWFAPDSYYSHGFLIPLASGVIIWNLREQIKTCPYRPTKWGMVLIIVGILAYLFCSMARIYSISSLSFLVVIIGMILHFFGTEVFKKIAFPTLFLIFMIPLPLVVITNISFKLKLFAAEIAAMLLNNMGIPAVQDGSIIKMRQTFVIVDDVCSGLRSLIALTALGVLFAYMMKSTLTKRILLFLSTIPIAIITNVCRVIFLSAISEIWGAQYVKGLVHDVTGYMVFVLAFIMLFAVGKLLE